MARFLDPPGLDAWGRVRRGAGASRVLIGAAIALALMASRAAAQPVDPALEKDIIRLMDVTGSGRITEQMATVVSQQMMQAVGRARPDVPHRTLDIVDEVVREKFTDAVSRPGGLISRMVPLYAKYFTRDEIAGMLAFYDTPLGRKAIATMPQLLQDGAKVGQQWAAELVPEIQAEIDKQLTADGVVPKAQ